MHSITSKVTLKEIVVDLLSVYNVQGIDVFIQAIQKQILNKKVRFPLLEFVGVELSKAISDTQIIVICDKITSLYTIGGNVLTGIILQQKLQQNFNSSINKACDYIIIGNQWYVCDIIGERVMGFALLTMPNKTIPVLQKFTQHNNKWIVRSIGVATHYAIKKGLEKKYVVEMFALLLDLSNKTEFHTKKGIGWAAKTTAKFYPDIIEINKEHLESSTEIKQWFKTKIKIGLSRQSKYASGYKS